MSDIKESCCRKNIRDEINDIISPADMPGLFDPLLLERHIEQLSDFFCDAGTINSHGDLVQLLDDEKAVNHVFSKREGLNTLKDWGIDNQGHLAHKDGKFFRIVGMRISSPFREVRTWSQPILDNEGTGIIGLLMKRDGGGTHFLMQAKTDVGNRNTVQIGPTIQLNPGNYIDNSSLKKPFLFDEFYGAGDFINIFESRQSEEGGRFYREEHIHRILELPDDRDIEIPSSYKWFSYSQIRFFLYLGDYVNSCARSILACLV